VDAFSDFVRKPASSQIFSFLMPFPSSTPRARAARPYNLPPILISFFALQPFLNFGKGIFLWQRFAEIPPNPPLEKGGEGWKRSVFIRVQKSSEF